MIEFIKKSYRVPFLAVVVSLFLYWTFAYQLDRADFPRLIGLFFGLFLFAYTLITYNPTKIWVLISAGILFRIILFPAIPNLSQDFYRFLWDGRLLIQGVNPYIITPELFFADLPTALEVTSGKQVAQASELYAGMGSLNASHYSNYPPINQLCFAIAALLAGKSIVGSAMVLRVLIVLVDIGILYFGKKLLEKINLPVKNIFWYFLNPFIIIEMTGNLHFEGVMLFFVVASLYLLQKGKWFWAAVLLGVSVSVKLLPLLLLPLFYKWFFKKDATKLLNSVSSFKFYFVVLGTVLLTFAPFLSSEFVSNFSATIGLWFQTFEFNASVYYIIRWIGFQIVGWNIIGSVGKILPFVVILVLLLLTFFRRNTTMQQLITAMLLGVSAYFLLSTTVHPWYIATPLILSVFTRYRFPIVWSFMVILSYSAYGAYGFQENLWLVGLEYFVVIGMATYEISSKKSLQFLTFRNPA